MNQPESPPPVDEAPSEAEPGPSSHWLTYGLPVVLAVVLVAPFLHSSPLAGRSEYRRAIVAKNMAESGDWLVPRFEGQIYLKKPPLHPWLTAASVSVTGAHTNEWLLRFPSLLALILFGVGSAWLGSVLWRNPRDGALAGVLTTTMFLALRESLVVELDILFAGLTVTSSAALVRALQQEQQWRRWILAGQLLAALALLTKGPLALLFAWLPALAWALHRRLRWSRVLWPPGLLLLVLPVAVWIALLAKAVGPDTLMAVWRGETVGRVTGESSASTHHVRAWWYYLTRLPAAALPGLLLLAVLPDRWSEWKERSVVRQTLRWTALVVFVLTFIPSKRTAYLLPLVPWLAVALAPLGWQLLAGGGPWTRRVRWGLIVLLVLALPSAVAAVIIALKWEPMVWIAVVPLALAALATLVLLRRWRDGRWGAEPLKHRAAAGLLVLSVVGWLFGGVVKPLREGTTPTKEFLAAVAEHTTKAELIGSVGVDSEAMGFHLGRTVEEMSEDEATVVAFLDRPGKQLLMVEEDALEEIPRVLEGLEELVYSRSFEGDGPVYLMREK